MAAPDTHDLFFSYHRADAELARRLVGAFQAAGLSVFLDEGDIERFESITARLAGDLARSKALLALYSATYPTRRACQFELTAAFLAGQRSGDPRQRVLVVNPENGVEHIEPGELADALFSRPPAVDDAEGLAELAQELVRHVEGLAGSLGDVRPLTPPSWFGMHGTASPRFVGRLREMWEIHSELHAAELAPMTGVSGPGVAQVRGMGGVGKTLLAQEYALRFGAAYRGGVFWLEAPGGSGESTAEAELEAELARQVRELAMGCGAPVAGLSDPAEVRAALAAELGRRGEPFLWVVDDFPSGVEAEHLREWFAPHPLGKTLVTTRSGDYAALAPVVEPGVLSRSEAGELLAAHCPPAGEEEAEQAGRLAEDLGCHALAVEVAGTLVESAAGQSPFASVREQLASPSKDQLELAAELAPALPTGHEPSIAATLLSSIALLGEEGSDLLRLASVLASTPIPATFVDRVFAQAEGLSEEAAAERGMRARVQAERVSLAERSDRSAHTVHALVSRTIRFHDKPAFEREEPLKAAALAVLNEVGPDLVGDPAGRAELEVLIPHARQLARTADGAPKAALLAWLSNYDMGRGAYRSASELGSEAAELSTRLWGAEHPATLAVMGNLADTLRAQGELDRARKLEERVLEARERTLGADHPATLTVLGDLAVTLGAQGELGPARALEERVLEARERTLGADHPDTLLAMGNLAATRGAQGELGPARALEERVLEARERTLGADHPDTLATVGNLAETLRAQGELDQARRLQERVLEARERTLGADHPATLMAVGNLAMTLGAQGELDQARALEERRLEASERTLGADHPDTLTAMGNLAETLWAQGELDPARGLQERVLEASARTLGADHPETLRAMGNLAVTLDAQGELDPARALEERRLEASERTLGADHPDTLTVMGNLAMTLWAQGELDPARGLQERVLEASARTLGSDHPATLRAMGNLAMTLGAQGERDRARALEERVLEARERTLGADHPETLKAMGNLAMTLGAQGELDPARALEERRLEASERTLGADHPDTLGAMGNLAETLWAQGELDPARALEERRFEASERTLGADHPDTLLAMGNLAVTLWAQGEHDRARALEERVLEASERTLGADHPATLRAMGNLAETLDAQGELDRARALEERRRELSARASSTP